MPALTHRALCEVDVGPASDATLREEERAADCISQVTDRGLLGGSSSLAAAGLSGMKTHISQPPRKISARAQ